MDENWKVDFYPFYKALSLTKVFLVIFIQHLLPASLFLLWIHFGVSFQVTSPPLISLSKAMNLLLQQPSCTIWWMLQPHQIRPSLGTILPKVDQSESFSSKFGIEISRNQGDCLHVAGHVTFIIRNPWSSLLLGSLEQNEATYKDRERDDGDSQRETKIKDGERAQYEFLAHPGSNVNLSWELAGFLTLVSM